MCYHGETLLMFVVILDIAALCMRENLVGRHTEFHKISRSQEESSQHIQKTSNELKHKEK